MSPAPGLLPQVKELEEQLGRRPEPEELDLAQAALAAAEDEKLELRKRLEETERRLAGLQEEGGCLHPHPAWVGARGQGGLRLPVAPAPTAPCCSGVAPGEAGAQEPDPGAACTRAPTAPTAPAAATTCAHRPRRVSDTPEGCTHGCSLAGLSPPPSLPAHSWRSGRGRGCSAVSPPSPCPAYPGGALVPQGVPSSATGMRESSWDGGLPALRWFEHLPPTQKCWSKVPWWGGGILPAPRSSQEGAQAPTPLSCPARVGDEPLPKGYLALGHGKGPRAWRGLQGGEGPSPVTSVWGLSVASILPDKPEADDVKARAVQEMMERIKKGVVLRPAKKQVGRDLGSPHTGVGISSGSPGTWGGSAREVQDKQDAATPFPARRVRWPVASGGARRWSCRASW